MGKVLILCLAAMSILGACGQVSAPPSTPVVEAPEVSAPSWRSAADLDDVLVQAREEGKGVLVVVSAQWCGPCRILHRTVLDRQEFLPALQDDVLFVMVHLEDFKPTLDEQRAMAQFNVSAFPTYVVLDKSGKEVLRSVGSSGTLESHIAQIKKALGK